MLVQPKLFYFGTDPEFFFRSHTGGIVGSERILKTNESVYNVFLDGVQIELHPAPRAYGNLTGLAVDISRSFRGLKAHLEKFDGVKVDFTAVVDVSKEELTSLSRKSRILGCAPSHNLYGMKSIQAPKDFLQRSAGGHIHIGLTYPVKKERRDLVPILDIIQGNTSVLWDRDPRASERRKMYGRAGEFRLPRHGLEYRTLSNAWLRSWPLIELVAGLTATSVAILNTSILSPKAKDNPERELAESVDLEKVVQAIQNNDRDLAWNNWEIVAKFLSKWADYDLPLNKKTIPIFEKMVQSDRLEPFFPEDPFDYWVNFDRYSCQNLRDILR